MSPAKRRVRVVHIDPRVMHAPGACLRCDGLYRARLGLPPVAGPLEGDQLATVLAAQPDPYQTEAEYASLTAEPRPL